VALNNIVIEFYERKEGEKRGKGYEISGGKKERKSFYLLKVSLF
jgi:hypothetical protein